MAFLFYDLGPPQFTLIALSQAKKGIVTASSKSYFAIVPEATKFVSVTSLPLQRHKNFTDYFVIIGNRK